MYDLMYDPNSKGKERTGKNNFMERRATMSSVIRKEGVGVPRITIPPPRAPACPRGSITENP